MLDIQKLRQIEPKIIAIVNHQAIIQSILDFDYVSGKKSPSIVGIISTGKKYERFFYGKKELLIPLFSSIEAVPSTIQKEVNLFLNNASGRRTFIMTEKAISFFSNLLGGVLFAENMPEKMALDLYRIAAEHGVFMIGPSSVGLTIPSHLKLGAIGGTQAVQLISSSLFTKGNVAVFSASGGMTNEIISLLSHHRKHLSFALSFGGDRFPITTPKEAFLAAEHDPNTKTIVYYGELGGYDEYEVAKMIKDKQITKKVIVYIAGAISEMFETPPQFGHAKAMAEQGEETAQAKRKALREAGAVVADSFKDFVKAVKKLPDEKDEVNLEAQLQIVENRKKSLFVSTISGEKEGDVVILGKDQLDFVQHSSFAQVVCSLLLGRQVKSKELIEFTDLVLKLLVDNGPYQSGVINTMITARAGKDLVSSLVSGLLTIGPRFGGAINEAAGSWLKAVLAHESPDEFVESFAKQRTFIMGIGHKKYRSDFPDPRVNELLHFAERLKSKKYLSFALEVQKVTTAKKGNLILNVDGAIAAILLDILSEKENYSAEQLQELVTIEFFNSFFVLSRTVGFTAHYLDQKRLDEGLFRLSSEEVGTIQEE